MRFYLYKDGDYITQYGRGGHGGEEITQAQYEQIVSVVANSPIDTDKVGYRLKTDLTWEAYEKDEQLKIR